MVTYEYGPIREVGPDVFVMDGRWRRSPLHRRMTLIRNSTGELAVHSAIEVSDADLPLIHALGRVTRILVPNSLHASDASFYAAAFPAAQVLVPRQVEPALRSRLARIDGVLEDGIGWEGELEALPLAGTKMGEVLFYHRASRTLVTTDLVFNFHRRDFRGLTRLFMWLNNALDRFGPTRLANLFFFKDKAALRRSLRPVLELEIDAVIMSHGHVLLRDGNQELRRAFPTVVA